MCACICVSKRKRVTIFINAAFLKCMYRYVHECLDVEDIWSLHSLLLDFVVVGGLC